MPALKSRKLLKPEERRRTARRALNRVGKIQSGTGTLPRDCLISDISAGGVRLHVEGFEIPDEFILLLSGDDVGPKERICKVVWRLGYEVGAKFVGQVRRSGVAVV